VKVSLFITCICDLLAPKVGKDTVDLLERYGCDVEFPTAQTCCGQPAYNSGYLKQSKRAMKQMMKAFKDATYVVGPSGSCVGMIKQYPNIFATDSKWAEEANKLAHKTYELSQFLVDVLHIEEIDSTFQGKVTYHPSCHMSRLLGEREAPQKLLASIQGIELIDLPQQDICCGFGGTFAINYKDISAEMVKEKTSHIQSTGTHYIVGADMACLLNIKGRLKREGSHIKVKHIAEVLNQRS